MSTMSGSKEITKLLLKGCTCIVCDTLCKCKFYGEYYCGPEPLSESLHTHSSVHKHHQPLPKEGTCVYFKEKDNQASA